MDTPKRTKLTDIEKWLRDLDEEIRLARQQAGYPVDKDIGDGPNLDDEEADARFDP